MFTSLRSRLWLSYALVILGALFITGIILVLYLVRSPFAYRQVTARLRAVESLILAKQPDWSAMTQTSLLEVLQSYDATYDVRFLVFDSKRQLLADSRLGSAAALLTPRRIQLLLKLAGLRDTSGQPWLYAVTRLANGNFLVLASPRPKIALLAILRDEFITPFAVATLIALLLSLLAAFGLARWIGNPLQRLIGATQRIPMAEKISIDMGGPHEVIELTQAFNEMNTRLLDHQKSQREFVANVSHELKTPLTSIQGFAQALLDGTADTPAAQKQSAQVIYDESARMNRLVLDLLDLARLDAGTLDLQHANLDLAALLINIVEKFSPQARLSNVDIRLELENLPPIMGDSDRLAQVFTNLVDNAIKFTPSGGRIALAASRAGSGVQVQVADTGAGISPENLAHIFDRFFQSGPFDPDSQKHGSGLGLAIVKEIVGAHGGKISVRSEPGIGSTFTVYLPISFPVPVSKSSIQ